MDINFEEPEIEDGLANEVNFRKKNRTAQLNDYIFNLRDCFEFLVNWNMIKKRDYAGKNEFGLDSNDEMIYFNFQKQILEDSADIDFYDVDFDETLLAQAIYGLKGIGMISEEVWKLLNDIDYEVEYPYKSKRWVEVFSLIDQKGLSKKMKYVKIIYLDQFEVFECRARGFVIDISEEDDILPRVTPNKYINVDSEFVIVESSNKPMKK